MDFEGVRVETFTSPQGTLLSESGHFYSGRIWISNQTEPLRFIEYYRSGDIDGDGFKRIYMQLSGFDEKGQEIRKELYHNNGICTLIEPESKTQLHHNRLINLIPAEVSLEDAIAVKPGVLVVSLGIYRIPDGRIIAIRADRQKMQIDPKFIQFWIGKPGNLQQVGVWDAHFSHPSGEMEALNTERGIFKFQTLLEDALWMEDQKSFSLVELDDYLTTNSLT